MINKKAIINTVRETMHLHKNILISGEEGVGKITNTLEAIQDMKNVFYIGNPVDYAGKPRPKGYDKYIKYITSLKKDMHVFAGEDEMMSLATLSRSGIGAILVVDEIYGRSPEQFEQIMKVLDMKHCKVFIIAGCMKNAAKIIQKIDAVLMFTQDGALVLDKKFVEKICVILRPEPW